MKAMEKRERKIARRMLDAGREHREIAERLGRPVREIEIYAVRLANLRRVRITSGAEFVQKTDQLCWHCGLSTGRPSRRTGEPCPWVPRGSASGRNEAREPPAPVPGWEAERTTRTLTDYYGTREVSSFRVTGCPLFEKEGGEDHV